MPGSKFAHNYENVELLVRRVYHVQRHDLEVQAIREVDALVFGIMRYLHGFNEV